MDTTFIESGAAGTAEQDMVLRPGRPNYDQHEPEKRSFYTPATGIVLTSIILYLFRNLLDRRGSRRGA